VSIQQRPSTYIALFERTHQNEWFDAVATPFDKERVHSFVLKHFFLEKFSNKKIAKNPWKFIFSRTANIKFSNFDG